MNFKLITIMSSVCVAEITRRIQRNKRQRKLQNHVDKTAPVSVKRDTSIADNHIQITIIQEESFDLTQYKESPISKDEADQWKSLFSTTGSEAAKTVLTATTFNGLVKCDVPLKDLCRIKSNPESMRGFVIKNGKISKQASFSEIGIDNIAPLLVYQYIAAITSQYYQQIITERLNAIDVKLNNLIKIITTDDHAKLKVAYSRFVELSSKSTYDIADKQIASNFSDYVEIIREKYKDLLSKIKNLNISSKWSDKKEAELKIQSLQDSHYLDYLEMAIQAEALSFMASAISIRVATYLGNDEDVNNYVKRMNLDYWNNYIDQFNKIKHDVIKYLESEADSSWFQKESIIAMKKQVERFKEVEDSIIKLQTQFEYKTVQFIKFQEDGIIKKYISLSKS